MIEFSGVSMDPKTNGCNVPGCANGACTSVWNYPGIVLLALVMIVPFLLKYG